MARTRLNLRQYSSGIIVPVLILAIGFAAYFALIPKYKQAREVKKTLLSKQSSFSGQAAQFQSVKSLIKDLQEKEGDLEAVSQALPSAPQIPELLSNFDYLARQSGLLIANLQFTQAPTLETLASGQGLSQVKKTEALLRDADNLAVMQVDIVMKGKYLNLKTFLINLEQNLRVMDILALTFGPVDTESGLQDYTLKIQTYYQK